MDILVNETRRYWIEKAHQVVLPVFFALAKDCLKKTMPVEVKGNEADRLKFTYLGAFARSLVGIAPWLQTENFSTQEEGERNILKQLILRSLKNATNPNSLDFMNFTEGDQLIVDAAFSCNYRNISLPNR